MQIMFLPFYVGFMNLEKAFDRVQRKVLEWAMKKKGMQEVLSGSVMGLFKGVKT